MVNNVLNESKRSTDDFSKTPYLKTKFQISKYTDKQQQFLTKFNFQHFQISQQEIEELAELLLKYPMVKAKSKFDLGNTLTTTPSTYSRRNFQEVRRK